MQSEKERNQHIKRSIIAAAAAAQQIYQMSHYKWPLCIYVEGNVNNINAVSVANAMVQMNERMDGRSSKAKNANDQHICSIYIYI